MSATRLMMKYYLSTLGPEPIEPGHPTRLPSDEWLDDHQQGLHPGGSEPRHDPYAKYMAMPNPVSWTGRRHLVRAHLPKRYVGTSTLSGMNHPL